MKRAPIPMLGGSALAISLVVTAALAVDPALCAELIGLPDGKARLEGHTIVIDGILTPPLARDFKRLLEQSTNVTTVRVTSEGGITIAGLDIAEEMQRRRLDLVVDKYCLSSCASYLFVAAEKKTVNEDSIVGWHGGHSFTPVRPEDQTSDIPEKLATLRREQYLYGRAGVSLDLINFSGLITLGFMREGSVRREYTLWAPSPDELKRLGVRGIDSVWFPPDRKVDRVLEHLGFKGEHAYTGSSISLVPSFLQTGPP